MMFSNFPQQMPYVPQAPPQQNGLMNYGNIKNIPHIDELEKKILDIRSMAAEEKTGIESLMLNDYKEIITAHGSSLWFEPCRFVYYMYEEGGTDIPADEAYDEDSAIQKLQLETDLENKSQDPKASGEEKNLAKKLKVRAVKGIKKLKSHISPLISNKLKMLEDKKDQIGGRLNELEKKIAESNNKFIAMKVTQKGLYRKLLNILHKVECVRKLTLIVDDRERQMEEKLIVIDRNLRGPFTDVQLLTSMKITSSVGGRSNTDINDGSIDPDSLKKILGLLEPQRQGLEHLSKVAQKDNDFADEMINKIKSLKISL